MSDVTLCTEEGIARVREALEERDLDGWLLYEFRGANPIAKSMLGVGKTTRRAFFLVPRKGEPRALIHAIEGSAWRHWPWARRIYSGWRDMEEGLAELVGTGGRLAAEVSPGAAVPTLDYLPAGLAELLLRSGVELASSGDLVSIFHSVWSAGQLADHEAAAEALAGIAREAFERAAAAVEAGEPTTEGALSAWIRERIAGAGFPALADCIVAVGRTASDPHYTPVGEGERIVAGEPLLIDLWGGREGSVPADQTWMGVMGRPDDRLRELWDVVRDARDAALDCLQERAASGTDVRGFEVDDVARAVVTERGWGKYFVHRTGHSIDTALHGSGPNLDNLETRDDRILVPGVGFSVEPGVYVPGELGVRTEVDVYWGPGGPVVTPADIQRELLTYLDD